MPWIDTPESSNIKRFHYAPNILTVEFNHGGVYRYFDVPESVFEEMKAAESKGKFLAQRIKKAFVFHKVENTNA